MEQEVLAARTEALGARHPDTLTTQANMAVTLTELGRTEEAIRVCQQALDAQVEVLGPGHPQTQRSQSQLAHLVECRERSEPATLLNRHRRAGPGPGSGDEKKSTGP